MDESWRHMFVVKMFDTTNSYISNAKNEAV